jgi:hypothetical protein
MPTPDSSQFTQLKKYQAIDKRSTFSAAGQNSHLYQPVPAASLSNNANFLASFSNKSVRPTKFDQINHASFSTRNNGYKPASLVGARRY